MTQHARGTFEVRLVPQGSPNTGSGSTLSRMSIDKTFSGDIQGTSVGEMLSAMTETKGSAGYVAIERVTGTVHGKKGSFVLSHTGTMSRGTPGLAVTIVPDSGSEELTGIAGTFSITIEGKQHLYDLAYTLPGGTK